MDIICRIKELPINVSTPTLLLVSLLWLLSGCMTQALRDNNASTAEADIGNTDKVPEAVAGPTPARPNSPNEQLTLPKHDTPAVAAQVQGTSAFTKVEKPAKIVKPALPASTVVGSPVVIPGKQPDAEPAADSSAANKLAKAEPASPRPGSVPAEAQAAIQQTYIMHLDLASLPLSFGRQWVLDRRPNPVTKETQCILASEAVNIPDGYERTNVQVLLTLDSIYVNTDSNIDLSYPQTGIRIGTDTLRPFDKLTSEKAAMVSGDDVAALYASMTSSPDMVVRLGFWPTWPVTETREASYSLEDFQTAVMALRACNRM